MRPWVRIVCTLTIEFFGGYRWRDSRALVTTACGSPQVMSPSGAKTPAWHARAVNEAHNITGAFLLRVRASRPILLTLGRERITVIW
jgi:hypothetical protein